MNKQSQWLFEIPVALYAIESNSYTNFEQMVDWEASTVVLKSPRFRNDSRLQAAANNRPVIRQGERGAAVQKLQQALIDLGFPMPISTRKLGRPDGIYGAETTATVRKFQQKYGLKVDGVAGSNTMKRLDELFTSTSAPPTSVYTQCDFIDPRIDVDAQYALFEMLKGNAADRAAAIGMLSAVKNGRLGGIYKEDQRVPAKRAQKIGKTWWTLIPSGSLAICVTQPASEPPIIVFKRSLKNRSQLGQALRVAWSTCEVQNPKPYPPSGKVCPKRPTVIKVPDVTIYGDVPPKVPPDNRCAWEQDIDWDILFARRYEEVCMLTQTQLALCNTARPMYTPFLPPICRWSNQQIENEVDRLVYQGVYAEVFQRTGIVAGTGSCGIGNVISQRYANWKTRTGKKCT